MGAKKTRYTPPELSKRWGISQNTLRNWRYEGKGPDFIKVFGRIYYEAQEIHEYEKYVKIEIKG